MASSKSRSVGACAVKPCIRGACSSRHHCQIWIRPHLARVDSCQGSSRPFWARFTRLAGPFRS
ncbi:hypothetical protein EXIGLDRAFT_735836, partial [Exidia glandulosa HHB12029]